MVRTSRRALGSQEQLANHTMHAQSSWKIAEPATGVDVAATEIVKEDFANRCLIGASNVVDHMKLNSKLWETKVADGFGSIHEGVAMGGVFLNLTFAFFVYPNSARGFLSGSSFSSRSILSHSSGYDMLKR